MDTISVKFSPKFSNTRKMSDTFVIYTSDDYENMPSEVKAKASHGRVLVKTIGKNLPRLADWTIQLYGQWKKSDNYGFTFYCDRYEMVSPSTLKGIVRFLCSKIFNGIGQKLANAIVAEYGEDTLDIIERAPEKLLRVAGINIDKMKSISASYQENISFSKLSAFLSTYGVSPDRARKIHDMYPNIDEITNNPYILINVRGVGFKVCEKIARSLNVALDSIDRVKAAILQILRDNSEGTGGTFMVYSQLEEEALKMLNDDAEHISLAKLRQGIVELKNGEKIAFRSKFILLKSYDDAENYIASKIKLFSKKLPWSVETVKKKLTEYCTQSSLNLSDQQKEAVINSMTNRISVITGGAGTGKTTIMKAIIAVNNAINRDALVTLLAPTGKAARRMTEAVGLNSQTIHSKLRIYEDGQTETMIEPSLIIVDECSMVDTLIMEKLLRAIDATQSHLILIGDVYQLPSVGAGSVLDDLISSDCVKTTKLTETFRQKNGSSIIENANKVKVGDIHLGYDQDFKYELVKGEEEAVEVIKNLYKKQIAEYGIDQVALLTPRKESKGRFKAVADELNSVIQSELITEPVTSCVFNGNEFKIGDRVMQCKNTSTSANGDIGTITNIVQDDTGILVKIDWENGESTEETKETMANISLAYAMSIHKSQGSQYDAVIIPLLRSHVCPIYRSNLLYTGITRAKKKMIIVADDDYALEYCISHKDAQKRNTLLSAKIKKECLFSN